MVTNNVGPGKKRNAIYSKKSARAPPEGRIASKSIRSCVQVSNGKRKKSSKEETNNRWRLSRDPRGPLFVSSFEPKSKVIIEKEK
jgi:hypothetical protein